MKKGKKITDAELYVMKVLWKNSPLTASQIIDELKEVTQWNPKTIHTLISRLVAKSVIGSEKKGSYKLYFPLVTEEYYQNVQTKSFLEKVYNGSFPLLITNFIKEEKLNEQEINELKAILDSQIDEGEKLYQASY